MNWQANMSFEVAKARASFLRKIREFFYQRNVVEVETPLMSQGTITDVHLEAFKSYYDYTNKNNNELYLQTSPEFAMKRLLASGYDSIYQMCKAFRHEPSGVHHNPEFTILEWYRIGYDMDELIQETSELLEHLLMCDKPKKVSYQELFINITSLDPLTCSIEDCLTYIKSKDQFSDWLATADIDTLLQYIFCQQIEPTIDADCPLFVYGFPASQAALAMINQYDERIANRFECYYQGLELLNGFEELTSAEEQLARFHRDNDKRRKLSFEEKPIDNNFIRALEHGLPNCSGVAIGVDRLFMLERSKKDIKQVLSFSINNA